MLEEQMEEQTDGPKKLHALIQESSVEVSTQLTEKSCQGVELFYLFIFIFFFGGGGGGVNMLISVETYRTYVFPRGGGPDRFLPLDPHMRSFFYSKSLRLYS